MQLLLGDNERAEQSTLTGNPSKRQHNDQAEVEQEIGTQEQFPSQLEHYAFAIGAFKDDPMLDAMMANIRERRRGMNADDNIR